MTIKHLHQETLGFWTSEALAMGPCAAHSHLFFTLLGPRGTAYGPPETEYGRLWLLWQGMASY